MRSLSNNLWRLFSQLMQQVIHNKQLGLILLLALVWVVATLAEVAARAWTAAAVRADVVMGCARVRVCLDLVAAGGVAGPSFL